MDDTKLDSMLAELKMMRSTRPQGRVCGVQPDGIMVSGLGRFARIGDRVEINIAGGACLSGEIVSLRESHLVVLPDGPSDGVSLGDAALLSPDLKIFPCDAWKGRVIDPNGKSMDNQPLPRGSTGLRVYRDPPNAVYRKRLGQRLDTKMAVLNTLLPIVAGQRIGLFAGSGVGKTSLLGHLAAHMQADVVVIALIGERGREVRDFIDRTLGPEGMARSIIVAATSDQPALTRRQCAYTAMTIAEYFRDLGCSVLFLADSITRLAEAHREVAVSAGEPPSLRGFPPSMTHMITSLCERAGPGVDGSGDITGVFSVLVAGSDMDEPVADTLRGVLDGHIILDRSIAETGRYPAIDVVRSVSRSLPHAASEDENSMIQRARALLSSYSKSETMIRAGLYSEGNDPTLDQAMRVHKDFEVFLAKLEERGIPASFQALQSIIRSAEAYAHAAKRPSIR
ncbi:FliI/YscN family ATPase [Primorskyibacter sp. S187A]|uniref:FliI/YscN family ATPase n=1 Tax=Primorskyibacter sp. S187A TaxID=3415130 RepID=UPI003C7BDE34